MGMFKYHMMLRRKFALTVRVPFYGGVGLAKSSYNFCSGWLKTSYGELAENVRIPSYQVDRV